jgi:hypothetical protein
MLPKKLNKAPLPPPYILTQREYDQYLRFFLSCAVDHFLNWPKKSNWPIFGGINYTLSQIRFNGRNALIIHFASGIQLPDLRIGRVFHIYGDDTKSRNFQLENPVLSF